MHAEGEADANVAPFLAMAEDYLLGAGITEELATADGYALAAKALTLHFWDNRSGAPIPDGLASIIRQEQCRCRAAAAAATLDVSDSDTGLPAEEPDTTARPAEEG